MSDAFVAILEHDFAALPHWARLAETGEKSEGVHQLRVTLRRMRSALGLFRGVVPRALSRPWSDELRWIAGELGAARDLDVFIEQTLPAVPAWPNPFACPESAERLRALAQHRRAALQHERVRPLLTGPRYAEFCARFPIWLAQRAWEATASAADAKRQARLALNGGARLLDKQYRRLLAAGAHVTQSDAVAMHRLRIEGKKLRYAAEFFAPVFPAMPALLMPLKALQDCLGGLQDLAVTHELLRELLAEEQDRDLLFDTGALLGWQTRGAEQLLQEFDAVWNHLLAVERPWQPRAGGGGR